MKNIFLILSFFLFITGCNKEEIKREENFIYGKWVLESINHEPNEWLRDLSLATWQSLELILESNKDNSITFASKNSPDANIFPPSSEWTLEETSGGEQLFTGPTDGLNIDGAINRAYYVSLEENKLIISTLIDLDDCPEWYPCLLPVPPVQFKFIRHTGTNN